LRNNASLQDKMLEAITKKAPLTKKTLKPYSLSEARGCHLFSLQIGSNATTSSLLRQTCKLAVAIGKKVWADMNVATMAQC
jgi:hypothetical protein